MNTIVGIPAETLLYALLSLVALILLITAYSAARHPLAFRLGVRNLPRRKGQTALIVGGLALSTLIITSALGVGDTVDYSVKADVYEQLGAIDLRVGVEPVSAPAGFSLGAAAPSQTGPSSEFAADLVAPAVERGDGELLDGAAPLLVQSLPALNEDSELTEAAVEVRGLGPVRGAGLALPDGLAELAEDEVLLNQSLADALDAERGDTLLLVKGRPAPFIVTGIVPDGELAGGAPAVLMPLARAQSFLGLDGRITALLLSLPGDAESGVSSSESAVAALEAALGPELVVSAVKADGLDAAAQSAEFITVLFVTFGTFSIVSGILLIFLIFSVLAAERRSELGMSRAVGLQRADLIRQFVSEGLAYDLLAATVGSLLGVGAAVLLAQGLSALLSNGNLTLVPRVSLRSALIGYSLGLVITFFTVTVSSVRISRLNIIAAIRDLDLPSLPRERQWVLFLRPFLVWRAALERAGAGNRRAALRLFLLAGPKAVLSFWGGLLARGPVLLALGYLLAYVGVNVAEQIGVYAMGVSFFLIGLGQVAHWLGMPARAAFSGVGLALILYWALPTRSAGILAELESTPGDFFISGLFLVGGAIVLFLYNADSLLNRFAGFLGRFGRLLPVARVAVAYPLLNKGRTATTLAMFSVIIFTLVSTTTITNTFSNFLDPISGSGDYDVLVQANPFNPIGPNELEVEIAELVAADEMAQPVALASGVFAPVQAQGAEMDTPAGYVINGVDETFFATQRLELGTWAAGYDSPEAVWDALQADPTVIVIDDFSIDRGGDPTSQRNEDAFAVTSISASAERFEPVTVTLTGADGQPRDFWIIGVVSSAPAFFGATMSTEAAETLGHSGPNRFFLRLPPGADAAAAADAVEAALSQRGVQTTLPKEQLEASRATVRSVFYLLQGFIGLGLFIGVAALGVVTIRAVVERRQQIAVLRAIGFSRDMVQNVFLFEGFFVAGLAIVIGYGLALTFAYNLYLQVAANQGLSFVPPWPILAGIGVTIFGASLFTAWIPARTTARVVIAEALRYE